jgi:activator of HSP90 ATPase
MGPVGIDVDARGRSGASERDDLLDFETALTPRPRKSTVSPIPDSPEDTMPKTLQQKATFRAAPDKLFDIYLSSRKHSAATGAKAVMSRQVGGRFMAHAGHLHGRNLAIVRKRLIVQSWRASNWSKRDLDSILVLVFSKVRGGGRVAMVHMNVPDAHAASINRGWNEYYWKPWKAHLRRESRAR